MSSILIVMVVFIHSCFGEAIDYTVPHFIQDFCVGGLCTVVDPMFFAISGFLFFNNLKRIGDCKDKIKKRIRTLLVPYFIWNVMVGLFIIIFKELPFTNNFVNTNILAGIKANGLLGFFNEFFWKPAAFQLWFLRDLIVMVACSPILYYIIKYTRWISVLICAVLSYFIQLNDLVYFVLGGCISMNVKNMNYLSKIPTSVFIISVIAYLYRAFIVATTKTNSFLSLPGVSFIIIVMSIIVLWKTYDLLFAKKNIRSIPIIGSCLGYSFFIYLAHMPLFTAFKKVSLMITDVSNASLIILFFLNPLILVLFLILVAKTMQKFAPKVYSMLVGGR